jgi:hypothetical protein
MGKIIDWQALLDGHANGFDVTVNGARIGDSIEAIPLDRITSIDPRTPHVRHWSESSETGRSEFRVFDITDDGQEVEVPRETLLAELRQHGGRAYLERVTYELADGRIRKIWIRGIPLESLTFAVEADIERVLGPAIGIEREFGCAVRHFPERGLSVAWHVKEGRVEHVGLGPVEWTPPIFSASDVLHEWFAAASCKLAPEWEEPQDRASSRWVRYARVTALLRAFELGSPRTFAEGQFLEGHPISAYPLAAEALQKAGNRLGGGVIQDRDVLCRLFWWLLVYRIEAERLLGINSGWLVAGEPGILAALDVTGRTNDGVAAALAEVDALLAEMIAPGGKQIREREMIERWGWPEVDLNELEEEELL